jgi:hypothetical protein
VRKTVRYGTSKTAYPPRSFIILAPDVVPG